MLSFAYAARYVYTDTVTQNDNLLRITAYSDSYQTPLMSAVTTEPLSAPRQFIDSFGNSTHHVRVTSPHHEFIVLSVGTVCLRRPRIPEDLLMKSIEYDNGAYRFPLSRPLWSLPLKYRMRRGR